MSLTLSGGLWKMIGALYIGLRHDVYKDNGAHPPLLKSQDIDLMVND